MRKYFWVLFAVWICASASTAQAAVEFYGTKVASESFAERALTDSAGVDTRVTATARVEDHLGALRSLKIRVTNGSPKKINAQYNLTDYIAVLNDGRRVRLGRPEAALFPSGDSIGPNKTVVLRPEFGDLEIEPEEIAMIVCSLNLGETKIVLTRRAAPAPAPTLVESAPANVPAEIPAKAPVPESRPVKVSVPVPSVSKEPKTNFSSGNVHVSAELGPSDLPVTEGKAPVTKAKKPARKTVPREQRTADANAPAAKMPKTNFSSGNTQADKFR